MAKVIMTEACKIIKQKCPKYHLMKEWLHKTTVSAMKNSCETETQYYNKAALHILLYMPYSMPTSDWKSLTSIYTCPTHKRYKGKNTKRNQKSCADEVCITSTTKKAGSGL